MQADQNLFRQKRNMGRGSLHELDNEDLEVLLEEENGSEKRKRRAQSQMRAAKQMNDFEKAKLIAREKNERVQKYAKYIKELNLPLELNRDEIRQEAQSLIRDDSIMKDRIAISRLNSQNPSMQIIENRRKTANPQMNSRKILRK